MKQIFKDEAEKKSKYYGPSVISITVTKGGYLKGSRLYKTSRIIGRGVTKLHSQFNI